MIRYPTAYAVFDFETSGLSPKTDKIIEFAVKNSESGEITSTLIKWPDFKIGTKTTEITGITQDEIDEKGIRPQDAIIMFIKAIGHQPIIGHNAHNFDIPFLKMWVQNSLAGKSLHTYYEKFSTMYLDTAAIYRGIKLNSGQQWYEDFKTFADRIYDTDRYGMRYSLSHCCNEYRIPIEEKLHRAAADVALTEKLYLKLINE